jgi:hypothetical protein
MKIKYKHLIQKPSFCGPTSLQMVLFRRGFWTDQEELAKKLKAKIRNKNKDKYTLDFEVDNKDAGMPLERFSEANDLLDDCKLKAKVIFFDEIENIKELITENLSKGNDIIINFHRGQYDSKKSWGHFALISAIENDEIEICDPSYEDKSYWKTSIEELMRAMSDEIDGKMRGIVIISEFT